MAHLLQIETFEHVEGFDECRTLSPETGFIDFITAIARLDWLAHLRRKFCKIIRRKQSAVGLHVSADAARDWTTIEIVTRGHEAGVTIVSRASRCKTLGFDYLAQRARQVSLHEDIADFRHFTARQENAFCIRPLRKDRRSRPDVIHSQFVEWKAVGELNGRFHYFGQRLRSKLIERDDAGVEHCGHCR